MKFGGDTRGSPEEEAMRAGDNQGGMHHKTTEVKRCCDSNKSLSLPPPLCVSNGKARLEGVTLEMYAQSGTKFA